MKQLLVFVFSFFSFVNVYAQFNDTTFYMLRYAATGILNRTNEASAYTIANGLRFSVNKKAISLKMSKYLDGVGIFDLTACGASEII